MRLEDIYVGQSVKIRKYKDLVSEFGKPRDKDIICDYGVHFTHQMRGLCGCTFRVLCINKSRFSTEVVVGSANGAHQPRKLVKCGAFASSKAYPDHSILYYWITPGMIEPADEEVAIPPPENSDVMSILLI